MEHNSAWEANASLLIDNHCILWNLNVHDHVHEPVMCPFSEPDISNPCHVCG